MEHKTGIVIGLIVFTVVGLFIYFNIQYPEPTGVTPDRFTPSPVSPDKRSKDDNPLSGIETPIGEAERNEMLIAAVWLPPIQMEAQDLPQQGNVIHLEADIHALDGNRNGFGTGAWIPYLTVSYEIRPVDGGESIRGEFMPMVAKDGPHYGATIEMPAAGKYKLTYTIDNPSKKGFGRHNDPITGVEPWWNAFEVTFDFDYPGSKPASSESQ
jgi:hypothetical protein